MQRTSCPRYGSLTCLELGGASRPTAKTLATVVSELVAGPQNPRSTKHGTQMAALWDFVSVAPQT